MVCVNCGRSIPEGTGVCAYCGLRPVADPPGIRSYLAEAILVTIFCFAPFGIVSIAYAAQVAPLVRRGDIDRARRAAGMARIWMYIGISTGVSIALVAILTILVIRRIW